MRHASQTDDRSAFNHKIIAELRANSGQVETRGFGTSLVAEDEYDAAWGRFTARSSACRLPGEERRPQDRGDPVHPAHGRLTAAQ